jgi:hypothetical protein
VKLVQYLLISAIALLQAAAPLLHAHLGGDRLSPHRVHLHIDLHMAGGTLDQLTASDPLPSDSAAIGLGQEIRRDLAWDTNTAACLALVLCVPAAQRTLPPRPADLAAHLPQLPSYLAPPPQGPPAATA